MLAHRFPLPIPCEPLSPNHLDDIRAPYSPHLGARSLSPTCPIFPVLFPYTMDRVSLQADPLRFSGWKFVDFCGSKNPFVPSTHTRACSRPFPESSTYCFFSDPFSNLQGFFFFLFYGHAPPFVPPFRDLSNRDMTRSSPFFPPPRTALPFPPADFLFYFSPHPDFRRSYTTDIIVLLLYMRPRAPPLS